MTEKHKHPEYKILARLLEMADDEFSNHGCNDFELDDTPENRALVHSAEAWNNGEAGDYAPDELNIQGDKIIVMDWLLMAYFSHLFRDLAENEK